MIDPNEVDALFRTCLCTDDEMHVSGDSPDGPIIVEGINGNYAFHPARLTSKRDQIAGWLETLPTQFRKDEGGGWSFLQACFQADGTQWTGLHRRMEQLFCLGMGLGLVECLVPRQMWGSLPQGMPYYSIDVSSGKHQ